MAHDKGQPFHPSPVPPQPRAKDTFAPDEAPLSWDDEAALDQREEDLLDLLWQLDGVSQDPYHHPEGDALYHSLQVFQYALAATDDPELLAAALLHDVGKAEGSQGHAARGAAWLDDVGLSARICWLVAHHMDLLYEPKKTRRRLATRPDELAELEALRRWDREGRDPRARVMSPEEAVATLVEYGL